MWLENNSSFEDISPQINKKSEAETIIDMDKLLPYFLHKK